jgi:hypothetical protein
MLISELNEYQKQLLIRKLDSRGGCSWFNAIAIARGELYGDISVEEAFVRISEEPKAAKRYANAIAKSIKPDYTCRKCGGNEVMLIETVSSSTRTVVLDNGVLDMSNVVAVWGIPFKIEVECECGHKWRIDRFWRLEDLPHIDSTRET